MRWTIRARRDSSIPTSSTADIAFLLIVFFMVTTVFSATRGLDLSLPGGRTPLSPPAPRDAVLIHVRATDTLVDCRPMAPGEIVEYLEPRLARDPDKPIILYTDSDAEFRRMVEVYDALASAPRTEDGRPSAVANVFLPTRSEIAAYVAMFGRNPLDSTCGAPGDDPPASGPLRPK